jgi:hypothetical protein
MNRLGFETGLATILASGAGEIEGCRAWAMECRSPETLEQQVPAHQLLFNPARVADTGSCQPRREPVRVVRVLYT